MPGPLTTEAGAAVPLRSAGRAGAPTSRSPTSTTPTTSSTRRTAIGEQHGRRTRRPGRVDARRAAAALGRRRVREPGRRRPVRRTGPVAGSIAAPLAARPRRPDGAADASGSLQVRRRRTRRARAGRCRSDARRRLPAASPGAPRRGARRVRRDRGTRRHRRRGGRRCPGRRGRRRAGPANANLGPASGARSRRQPAGRSEAACSGVRREVARPGRAPGSAGRAALIARRSGGGRRSRRTRRRGRGRARGRSPSASPAAKAAISERVVVGVVGCRAGAASVALAPEQAERALEAVAQREPPAVDPRLHGPQRDAGQLGDLGVVVALDVEQDDRRAAGRA